MNSVMLSPSSLESSPMLRGSKPQLNSQMSLLSLQKSRKQMETDAQTLANRIQLLQREETQIWRSLEMAKTRAREVYLHKKRTIGREQEVRHRNSSEINILRGYIDMIKIRQHHKVLEESQRC